MASVRQIAAVTSVAAIGVVAFVAASVQPHSSQEALAASNELSSSETSLPDSFAESAVARNKESAEEVALSTDVEQLQSSKSLKTDGAAASSRIRLEPAVLDLGDIAYGEASNGSVRVFNESMEPISILRAKTSCGCTVADIPENPIDPGSFADVDVRFSVKGQHGDVKQKTVTLLFEGHEPVQFPVRGTVVRWIQSSPASFVRKLETPASLAIVANDDAKFRITKVTPDVLVEVPTVALNRHSVSVDPKKWAAAGRPHHIRFETDHPFQSVVLVTSYSKRTNIRAAARANQMRPHREVIEIDVASASKIARSIVLKNVPDESLSMVELRMDPSLGSIETTGWVRTGRKDLLVTFKVSLSDPASFNATHVSARVNSLQTNFQIQKSSGTSRP